ncbi:acyl-protein synthetase [Actinoplanes ianthinogenes]|uniref:Acyl-protein synthetase n=1 Tax=Actinoplanes ianthinogenes TaxID=122358 RepID=A0ABN6CER2_9ACTN|nr:acyl-protein synthetase [Actinoplanes ianthinogenes]BCJ44020.1 acyl-protein synthetase [Actinoplanes ianthinogenes]GGR39820.1 acyl-protein synthetase [Actinoplanes ianthinogenes]
MSVFTLPQAVKEERLLNELSALVDHHRDRCEPYARILAASGYAGASEISALPWLPVRLFKTLELKSIPDDEVFKVLTSSGTTGDVSRIHLDKAAAAEQQKRLAATVQTVLGPKRLPMLLVDTKAMLKDRRSFSARGAGVLGMSTFGRDHVWALDPDGQVDLAAIRGFLDKHGDAPFLIFGFTFLVWLHLYEVARDNGLDLSNGILIHSGGWKKLIDQAVSPDEFRARLAGVGLTRVHNYYGMVEQIGTIFLEGPDGGALYCPDFADVVIRDPRTWAELPPGEPGLIEVISTLPTSYPGHVLLTEDLGVVHGIDDGAWPGKRFSVLGRLPRAEARGCSDTYREAA